jgi:hypothetical protein
MARFLAGDIGLGRYRGLLRQIFHDTRDNPQMQAMATVYFRGAQRAAIKGFYRHAISEIGHDQLAMNDLVALGEDVSQLPFENPLPATTALLAYPFYQISNLNPVGYLGYLFFLEFMPTGAGKGFIAKLREIGVPDNALSFITDHTTIDVGHNRAMETYVGQLVRSDADLQSVLYAMRVTGRLYADMIAAAFEQADQPLDWGRSPTEPQVE